MLKKSLCTAMVVMFIFTFSFAGTMVSKVNQKSTASKKTKTTTVKKSAASKSKTGAAKSKTPSKTSAVKAKTPPKTSTTKPKTPPKTSTHDAVKPQPKDINKEIVSTLDSYLNEDSFSGYALVSREGSVIYQKGFGKADFKEGTDNTIQTKYGIASITKQFTSLSVMQLEEKGLLKVEDHVNKYLPNFPYGDKITIHQLLTHTSGLPEQPQDFDIRLYRPSNEKGSNKANDDKVKLLFEPGMGYQYSNTGYILLGYIIEKVSGKTLDVYFKENIFDPLGMQNTAFKNEQKALENKATGYLSKDKDLPDGNWSDDNVGYVRGSSGLCSTPEDLLKWETALTDEKLISRQSYEKMYNPYDYGYGYGWFINSDENNPSYYHYGVAGDYITYIYRRPSDKLIVIIISNYGNYNMNTIQTMLGLAIR